MEKENVNQFFVDGAILPIHYAKSNDSIDSECGAELSFFGVVRADKKGDSKVIAIDYSAYTKMAEKAFQSIVADVLSSFDVYTISILHSLGEVKVGEKCLYVSVESPHRKEALEAMDNIIDLIKAKVPIWKEEKYSDSSINWVKEDEAFNLNSQKI